jgi:lipopolysaccharide export system permease protein
VLENWDLFRTSDFVLYSSAITEARVIFSILHRMIFWELFKVFALSLLGITGIMLIGTVVAEASQQGFTLLQTLQIIPLIIPSTLPYTIPATTLFATCVVYGRLSHDNEILAIKAAGVNVLHVVKPALFLGVAMSAVTMGLYYRIIPHTHYMLRTMFLKDVEELMYTMLRNTKQVNYPHLNYAIFAERVEGRKLINTIVKIRDVKGQPTTIIFAREAELSVNLNSKEVRVTMRNCEVHSMSANGVEGCFPERTEDVPLPGAFLGDHEPRPRALSCPQILRHRQEYANLEIGLRDELDSATAHPELFQAKHLDVARHQENLRQKLASIHQKILQLDMEMQMRPALSLGCLFFVVIGCPVGIWFSRSDFLSAFITCFLPIMFLYYPLVLCGTNLAKEGRFVPALDIWAADAVMAVIGVLLFWRLLKN